MRFFAPAPALLFVVALAASACGRTELLDADSSSGTPNTESSSAWSAGARSNALVGFAAGPNGTRLDVRVASKPECFSLSERPVLHFFADYLPLRAAAQGGDLSGHTFGYEAWRLEPGGVMEYAASASVRFDAYVEGRSASGHWTFTGADGGVEEGDFDARGWCGWACPLGLICG